MTDAERPGFQPPAPVQPNDAQPPVGVPMPPPAQPAYPLPAEWVQNSERGEPLGGLAQPEPGAPAVPAASGPGGVVVKERAHPASPLVHLWLGVVALGWILLQELVPRGDGDWQPGLPPAEMLSTLPWWMLIVAAVVLVGLGIAYWGWWTTWFVIDDHELRIENRGAFTESKRIAFQRIQSVDISQPFAARILGLAQLTIDAGADAGTKLSFLSRSRATELRDFLMARAHGQRGPVTVGPSSVWDDLGAADRILIRLNPIEIVLGALLAGEFLVLVVAALVPMAISVAAGGGWVGALAVLTPLAFALVNYLSRRMFGQFNYTLAVTPAGLRITRGLTTLKSQTIPANRVQAIRISQPLIWRWLDRARLDVTVLGRGDASDGEDVSTATIFLPIGNPQQTRTALHALWPGLELSALTFRPSPERARWLDAFAYGWNGFALDDRVIVARQGWFNRRQYIVPHARLQSVRLAQGPLERRLGVADLALHTVNATGDDRIVHMDEAVARRLALDEVARSRTSRMDALLTARDEDAPR